MESCIHCVENHIGKARGLWEEALAGYPGRIGAALGELGLAEQEARKDYPGLATKIRIIRKNAEVDRLDAPIDFERLLSDVDAMITKIGKYKVRKTVSGDTKKEPCKNCGGKTARTVPEVIVTTQPPPVQGEHLILLTALRDFAPSYSLTSVILDQARVVAKWGWKVTIVGMTDMVPVRPRIEGVEYMPLIPDVGWKEDEVDDGKVNRIRSALVDYLQDKEAIVLTHDLLFQSWYCSFAKVFHTLPPQLNIRWYHQMHSSVGPRPPNEFARWRAAVPNGHTMVAPNWSDVGNLVEYYRTRPDCFAVIPNIRDARSFLGLGASASELMDMGIHQVDMAQAYPVSTPRMQAKGVFEVVRVFAQLKRLGRSVMLVLINAHASGQDGQRVIQQLKGLCSDEGLVFGQEVLLTSELWPSSKDAGLTTKDISDIMQLTNVFCFPSSSEACGLVMLEAALCGCLLVLNESLAVMGDFFAPWQAHWIRWGSIRENAVQDAPHVAAADLIIDRLASKSMASKRRVLQFFCLERLSTYMRKAFGLLTAE